MIARLSQSVAAPSVYSKTVLIEDSKTEIRLESSNFFRQLGQKC